MKKYALISVSNKTNIESFAREIINLGYTILSTGGTLKFLKEKQILADNIEEYIGFAEILDGRVKTLHPKIHGGLLGDINNPQHIEQMKKNNIEHIDILAVNLYPFEETINKEGHTFEEAIENIDIGGPSMIRSAAKNFKNVAVIVDPIDYEKVINELKENKGIISLTTRKTLAYKAFKLTSRYDFLIRSYLGKTNIENNNFKPTLGQTIIPKKIRLNYGENPQQTGTVIKFNNDNDSLSIVYGKQIQGKLISYNNISDGDAAISIVNELIEFPNVFIAIKHMNACGVGIDNSSAFKAWRKCYEGDKVSIFGGIIATNVEIDEKIASDMINIFLEVIIAPSFTSEALNIFSKKPNLRIIQFDCHNKKIDKSIYKTINGGVVIQSNLGKNKDPKDWRIVTKNINGDKYLTDLKIAWSIVKYLKSNAICIVQNGQLLGIGVGQTNRVQSVKLAIQQNASLITNAVLASDAFFPMPDSIIEIAKYQIKAIVQPGGSIKDQLVIDEADKHDLIMYFTGERLFLH